MQPTELERAISDIVHHIFKRPVLSVSPADSLLQVGTFLAIGPHSVSRENGVISTPKGT